MSSALYMTLRSIGALPPNADAQLRRWRAPNVPSAEDVPPVAVVPTAEEARDRIAEVLETRALTEVKETELDVQDTFLKTRVEAVLHLVAEGEPPQDVEVEVGRLPNGEFVFPWGADGIESVMTHPDTHLRIDGGDPISFESCRNLYEGDELAFMACRPRQNPPYRDPLSLEELRRA